jgi:transcription elongation factor
MLELGRSHKVYTVVSQRRTHYAGEGSTCKYEEFQNKEGGRAKNKYSESCQAYGLAIAANIANRQQCSTHTPVFLDSLTSK